MNRRRFLRRGAVLLAAALLVVGLIAPFINADKFGGRIRQALERSLGRKVEIGEVHFSLFGGPGFTVEDVLIAEDPAFGVEPFAHVLKLYARVGFSTLWTGRLEFSKLRLEEPSLNLVRKTSGGWNLVPLAARTAQQSSGTLTGLPVVEVRAARFYFKLDDTKSQFYLTDADLDIFPRRGGLDGFDISVAAQPARTDRRAYGYASLRAKGRVSLQGAAEPKLDVDLNLERTAIDDLVQLLRGQDVGVHGIITSAARISGPLSDIRITGNLAVDDVHRWDLMPRGGGWKLRYRGSVNWGAQRAELESADANMPVRLALHANNWLTRPEWSSDVTLAGLPSQSVLELVRHLGASVPAGVAVTGKLDGTATYHPASGWHGDLALSESDLTLGDAPPLKLASSTVRLDGAAIQYGPGQITGQDGQAAEVDLKYDPYRGAADLMLRANSLSIAELQTESGHLLTAAAVPLVEEMRKGRWTGWLRYQAAGGGTPGIWSGQFDLHDVDARVPGISDSIHLRSASVNLIGADATLTKIRGRAGDVEFSGDYRYESEAARPHRFNVAIPHLTGRQWERLLLPTLRREQGFLARTLRWRQSPPPAWLRERKAEGTVRIQLFEVDALTARGLRAAVLWDGTGVAVTLRDGKLMDGSLRGTLTADLSGGAPKYHFEGWLSGAPLKPGTVDIEMALDTRGLGDELLANLRADGTFNAKGLEVLPDAPLRTASGNFQLSVARTGPVLRLSEVQAAGPNENFTGQAATLEDGTLRVDLASAHRTMRYVGSLNPLRLDPAAAKP